MSVLRHPGVVLAGAALLGLALWAQRPAPRQEHIHGGILLHVLPPDRIPAIDNPQFVTAEEAEAFMQPDEPVLGIYDGEVAKAYSLWQLDHHEIVNDSTPGFGPIAVTW
ncbi:MAG: DUF3179 domain-containing (seleno)protein [Terriglobia bacterium]